MSRQEVDEFLAALDEPHCVALTALRTQISKIIPSAEEGISYGVPVFRIDGKSVAGFSSAKNHISYLPFSGGVIAQVDPVLLAGFRCSKAAVQIPLDVRMPVKLLRCLIKIRRAEAEV